MESYRIDGVTYEDVKANWVEYGNDILRIFNVILMNRKLPNTWKHAIIQCNPKKNFDRNDLLTLRDIHIVIHIVIANLVQSIFTLFMQSNYNTGI